MGLFNLSTGLCLKIRFKVILRALCWLALFLGVYSARVVYFGENVKHSIIHETEDLLNVAIYKQVTRNAFSLIFVVLCATGLLLWVKGYDRGVECHMAVAICLVTMVFFLIHAIII